MSYNGVLVSDDMQMKAISDYHGFKEAIILTVNAGIDILLFGNNLEYDENICEEFHKILREAVSQGLISEERIEESYSRITKLKEKI